MVFFPAVSMVCLSKLKKKKLKNLRGGLRVFAKRGRLVIFYHYIARRFDVYAAETGFDGSLLLSLKLIFIMLLCILRT